MKLFAHKYKTFKKNVKKKKYIYCAYLQTSGTTSVKNTSIFAWLGFIFAHKSNYDDYIATKKQLFIEKSKKINIFDISKSQISKYRY